MFFDRKLKCACIVEVCELELITFWLLINIYISWMSHSNARAFNYPWKKELSNRSRTCQVKPLPPLFGTAYPLSPEYRDREDPVHWERPMLSTIDVAWEICDSGNMLPFAPMAPRGHWHEWPGDSLLPSRATLPTSWVWATGLPGTRPSGLSNWAATVLLAAAGLTIDASCAVGHASITAYVSQISYPYGPCIPETLVRSHFSWIFVLAW